MKFKNDNKPPILINMIEVLEQKIGFNLPLDYRNFLSNHNGGQPEHQFLTIPVCHGEALIDYFLGIGRPHADIQEWLEELSDDLGVGFLPIALDPGGNILIMDKSDGKIYYWDSARHFPRSSDEENAFWVADSFSDLLEKLSAS